MGQNQNDRDHELVDAVHVDSKEQTTEHHSSIAIYQYMIKLCEL